MKNKVKIKLVWVLVLAISVLAGLWPNEAMANCKRSCYSKYKIVIHESGVSPNMIEIGNFESRRGCGCAVPDRCRTRARKAAQHCMEVHAQRKGNTPPEAKQDGVQNYWVKDFNTFIQGEVCNYLSWLGKKSPKDVRVSIYAKTSGGPHCKTEKLLYTMSDFDCPCKMKSISNPTLSVDKTSEKTIKMRAGALSYLQFTQRGKGKVYDYLLLNNEKRPVRSFNVTGDEKYKGCGIKTAQNALHYFNIDLKQKEILHFITARKVDFGSWKDKIFVLPADLRQGLEKILRDMRIDNVDVVRVSGKKVENISQYLKSGYPVIALVNNGNHWVTVVGEKNSNFSSAPKHRIYKVMDNSSNTSRSYRHMDLEFDDASKAAMNLLRTFNGGTSYRPGTLIYFRKR